VKTKIYRTRKEQLKTRIHRLLGMMLAALLPLLVPVLGARAASAAPAQSLITGEIERLTVDNPADVWSGGTMVVGGQNVIIPRNLLADFPAHRLSLQQTLAQAPRSCVARGESGLALADLCNTTKRGAIATIAANRSATGNVIAGDLSSRRVWRRWPGWSPLWISRPATTGSTASRVTPIQGSWSA
jgi:hypothetical protein